MIRVRFPRHLRRHVPVPAECQATAGTVGDVLQDLDRRFPGVSSYLIDERGSLRQDVCLPHQRRRPELATYRAGLPQDDCFDFVFRHGLDQSGNRLAWGTACGSFYLSHDRGES